MEVSVLELLAAAREIQGTDYVEGDRIMCEKRYEKGIDHMIEFSSLDDRDNLGKNRYQRRFLSESDYRHALESEAQGKIRIVRYARINGGGLDYVSPAGGSISRYSNRFREA
jgi:hypothetical protein